MRWSMIATLCLATTAAAQPYPGDLCTDAIPVTLPSVHTGDTTFYGYEPPSALCAAAPTSPNVWFTLHGTGFPVTASMCEGTFFDAMLHIYTGECDDLVCIATVDDACGSLPFIEWQTQAGERYYVVVCGFGQMRGRFTLRFEGTLPDEDCDGDGVADASQIAGDPRLDCFDPSAPAGRMGGPDGRLDACQCPVNWNRDGAITSADISAYLTAWLTSALAGNTDADIDCSGTTNSSDIAAFLTRWLAAITAGDPTSGCP
jgi:hypothetical protein